MKIMVVSIAQNMGFEEFEEKHLSCWDLSGLEFEHKTEFQKKLY